MKTKHNVGIRSVGSYVPDGIRDSVYISEASGIPEPVIREKFGIKQVHKAGPEDTVSAMGVKASLRALGDISPDELDMVVYCGSEGLLYVQLRRPHQRGYRCKKCGSF